MSSEQHNNKSSNHHHRKPSSTNQNNVEKSHSQSRSAPSSHRNGKDRDHHKVSETMPASAVILTKPDRNNDNNNSNNRGRSVKATTTTTTTTTTTITSNPSAVASSSMAGKRNVTDILKNAFVAPVASTSSAVTTSTSTSDAGIKLHSREMEIYGVIISIRNSFGFLQAIFEEEQYYFSDREFYDNMKVGDRVAFIPRSSPKGPSANNVRLLIPTLSKIQVAVSGVVNRSPERHRSGCGLIEVDLESISNVEVRNFIENKYKKLIPYRPIDIVSSTLPKNHFLDKGDAIEFTVSKLHDCMLYFGTEIKLKQLKRDRVIALQIQRMLDAGAVREVGVITALKNKEYGFIRAQDRKDELYFRMDDIIGDDKELEEVR